MKIKIALYDCVVYFIICKDFVKEVSKIIKHDTFCAGLCVKKHLNAYYIFISDQYVTHNTIAHEIYHVTTMISEDRSVQEDEAKAWLNGYIHEEVYKHVHKWKNKI